MYSIEYQLTNEAQSEKMVKGDASNKGENVPPKEMDAIIGLKSGGKVIYRVRDAKLIAEHIPELLTALKLPKFAKTTVKEFEQECKELAEELVER